MTGIVGMAKVAIKGIPITESDCTHASADVLKTWRAGDRADASVSWLGCGVRSVRHFHLVFLPAEHCQRERDPEHAEQR